MRGGSIALVVAIAGCGAPADRPASAGSSSQGDGGAVLAVDPATVAKGEDGCTPPPLSSTLPGAVAAKRTAAVTAIDEGRHADARAALTDVLQAHPGNAASLALYAGLDDAIEAAQRDAGAALEKVRRFAPPTARAPNHEVLSLIHI